ncbi:nucleoside kinase [Alloalcanivorax gelatiniphagus]
MAGVTENARMGMRNFLVEGVSGTGKTAVCHELRRRGFDAVNGDTDLARPLAPGSAPVTAEDVHADHGWDADRVRALAADTTEPLTFFCGGSRNAAEFLDVFDAVFVLHVDRATLLARLGRRPAGEWGSTRAQRALVVRLHEDGNDVPPGVPIDASAPLGVVVDELVRLAREVDARLDG